MATVFRPDEPDPYAWDRRVRGWAKDSYKTWKRHRRLEVWCENGKCAMVRVFDVSDGRFVQCMSEANIKEMRESDLVVANRDWSKRPAFFITPDLLAQGPQLTLVCECHPTTERVASVPKIDDLVGKERGVSINAVLSGD